MSHSVEEYSQFSQLLSEVLDDVGMKEDHVNTKQELAMQYETHNHVYGKLVDQKVVVYHFGSNSEGTDTFEDQPDTDLLYEQDTPIVIKDEKFWKCGLKQLKMIRNKSVTPGYCLLQIMKTDIPLPELSLETAQKMCLWDIENPYKKEQGMVLLKNDVIQVHGNYVRNGPAFTFPGSSITGEVDNVFALKCDQWPDRARIPADEQNPQKWPTMDIKREAELTGCLVVPVAGKESQYEDLEWRISTAKAERILVLSLNIIQSQCYVLMKKVLKTFIHPKYGKVITSYMCKNVLFHQIKRGQQDAWEKHTLFQCLKSCMVELNNCVKQKFLPHFIIPENNLLRRKLTDIQHAQIVQEFENLIEMDIKIIFSIKTDDIGLRLHVKINQKPNSISHLIPNSIHMYNENENNFYNPKVDHEVHMKHELTHLPAWILINCHCRPNGLPLHNILPKCKSLVKHGSTKEKKVCQPLIPMIESSIGSIEASTQLANSSSVTEDIFKRWFPDSIKEENIWSCLKKASTLHCSGRSIQAEEILEEMDKYFEADTIFTLCDCKEQEIMPIPLQNIVLNKKLTTCMIFAYEEINSIPKEVQYERYRYTNKVKAKILPCITVDVSHFLYFLQFKVYQHLGRKNEKNKALLNLQNAIILDDYSNHTETAFNLLGQCLEEENRIDDALECYFKSFIFMPNNNMAIMHVCKLLCKIIHQKQQKDIH